VISVRYDTSFVHYFVEFCRARVKEKNMHISVLIIRGCPYFEKDNH